MNAWLLSLFPDAGTMKSIGSTVVIAGLVGEVGVLFVPSKKKLLEKILSAIFIAVIAFGVWTERIADNAIGAPRTLSDAQIADAKNRLKAFAPAVYAIGVSTDDPEQVHLADLIGIALEDAGWKSVDWYRDVVQHGPGGGGIGKVAAPAGIEIAPALNDSSGAAKALVDALHAEGLKAELLPFAALAPFPGIKIMIGTRM